MADPDIGDYVNDLTGCDTTVNSGFAYDKEDDKGYGNSPTVMVTLLQGAPVYIPDETFIDNNNNGIYDDGIDTPLDTAFYKYGKLLTEHEFPGAKNQNMTSFMHYISSHPTMGDPDDQFQLRNFQTGLKPNGDKVDPCNWEFGEVYNVNCSDVNPVFMYSGDPVTQYGWINKMGFDQRIMVNSGPYTLEPNEPIEIIAAYVVGRGNTSLESVNVTKKLAKNALGFYSTNFAYVPVGVSKKPNNQLPTEYSLSQNYPNPFNPSTTIKYSIPTAGQAFQIVQLKVYDILGREVATLVNKHQKPGNYEVQFNAKSVNRRMSSGVYFYTLKSGKFLLSKKMILLK
ncbi:MAG: T9SS type A sorting domain-containing protein [Chlorobi bacterium]|nr:T9SS type A sorting domain-containing protein [Chlorobiota bacterium]